MQSLAHVRLAAARYVLHLTDTAEIIRLADELLSNGVYTQALGELLFLPDPRYTASEPGPIFERAVRELGLPVLNREEAALTLVRQCLRDVAEGAQEPSKAIMDFYQEVYRDLQWESWVGVLPEAWGIRHLASWSYRYEEVHELLAAGYHTPGGAEEAITNLDREVLAFAVPWVRNDARGQLDPSWQTPNVLALAHTIDEDRCFERLPILAGALMDAGCENAEILEHCHGEGRHVHGCWVVDLLLGR